MSSSSRLLQISEPICQYKCKKPLLSHFQFHLLTAQSKCSGPCRCISSSSRLLQISEPIRKCKYEKPLPSNLPVLRFACTLAVCRPQSLYFKFGKASADT